MRHLPRSIALLWALCATAASAAAGDLDEVQVLGKKLWQMREEMLEAEERFYTQYNKINTEERFKDRTLLFE